MHINATKKVQQNPATTANPAYFLSRQQHILIHWHSQIVLKIIESDKTLQITKDIPWELPARRIKRRKKVYGIWANIELKRSSAILLWLSKIWNCTSLKPELSLFSKHVSEFLETHSTYTVHIQSKDTQTQGTYNCSILKAIKCFQNRT